jgi:glycosyltransferase involved in cell wall biosynthesis
MPPDPRKAAALLTEVLEQPERLRHWSETARTFARAHFHPREVARSYLDLYEAALRARQTAR